MRTPGQTVRPLGGLKPNEQIISSKREYHDMIKRSDYISDLGPGGGVNGGTVVVSGAPESVVKIRKSYTGR